MKRNAKKGRNQRSSKEDGCGKSSQSMIERLEVKVPKNADIRRRPIGNSAITDAVDNMLTNDPVFYNHSPEQVMASSNISFFTSAGTPIALQEAYSAGTPLAPASNVLPGIMSLTMVTGPGFTEAKHEAVNVAATDLYSYVRHENSGASNYDPVDLMLYILAMDECYAWYELGKRAYGSAFLYSSKNKYYPGIVLQAEGFTLQDVNSNLAQFNYYLNVAAGKLNALNVPQQFSYVERHRRLYRGIYVDALTGKAQLYLMRPGYYRVYDESAPPAKLKATPVPLSMTVEQWWTIFNSMVEAIRSSEDCGIISGDLLKAYGSENMIRIEPVPMGYVLLPSDDITLLRQFKNATALYGSYASLNTATFDITQEVSASQNGLVYRPRIRVARTPVGSQYYDAIANSRANVLDLSLENPSPMDVMEATRLMMQTEYVGQETEGSVTYDVYDLKFMGSEFVREVSTYKLNLNNQQASVTVYRTNMTEFDTSNAVQNTMESRVFDWRPVQYWCEVNASNQFAKVPSGEFNNIAVVDSYTLRQIHDTALLSEFSVPIHR